MIPQVQRVAAAYAIPVYSGGGFPSLSAVYEAAQRAVERDTDTLTCRSATWTCTA